MQGSRLHSRAVAVGTAYPAALHGLLHKAKRITVWPSLIQDLISYRTSFAHFPPPEDLLGQDPGERPPEQRRRHPHHEPAVGQEGQLQRPGVLPSGQGVWGESGMGCSIKPIC